MQQFLAYMKQLFALIGIPALTIYFLYLWVDPFPRDTRSLTSRCRTDMRIFATAIESYRIDHYQYPRMVPFSYYANRYDIPDELIENDHQALYCGSNVTAGLTTPNAYLTEFYTDHFIEIPYAYYTKNDNWIIYACGEDKDFDLINIEEALACKTYDEIERELLPYTYDPTNGIVSSGDVWRIKQ